MLATKLYAIVHCGSKAGAEMTSYTPIGEGFIHGQDQLRTTNSASSVMVLNTCANCLTRFSASDKGTALKECFPPLQLNDCTSKEFRKLDKLLFFKAQQISRTLF